MKQWRVAVILLAACWTRLAGGNLCTLNATASLNNNNDERLHFSLECGSITCPQTRFKCNGIHDELAIECTENDCGTMKTYTLCETPRHICVPIQSTTELPNSSLSSTAPWSSGDDKQQQCKTVTNPCSSVPALGALLGLLVVILIIVIPGWVWTSWTLKKKGRIKLTSGIQDGSFRNPMYHVTEVPQTQHRDKHQEFHNTAVPTPATIPNPSNRTPGRQDRYSHGPSSDKTVTDFNSQTNHCQQELQDVEDDYHLLGKEEDGELNITERLAEKNDDYADPDEEGEGWDQDENVYQVLEGPVMEWEGPNEAEATVYEVPIPSRPPNSTN